MLSARPWPPLYRDQPVQLDKPDRPLGQRPADTRPRCEFIQAPITSAMSEPFITNDLQDRKLARGEARCDLVWALTELSGQVHSVIITPLLI